MKAIFFIIFSLLYLHYANCACIEGGFEPSNDCSKFQQCANGVLVEKMCPAGLHWNKNIAACDWPISANCDSSSGPSSQTTEKPDEVTNQPDIEEPSTSQPTTSSEFKVVCYFTNWAFYRKDHAKFVPENIDEKLCTHIIYSFAVLDPQTLKIKTHDSWADIDSKFYEKVTAYRKNGIKVLIAIGGWTDSQAAKYGSLLSNKNARQNFIKDVVQFIKNNHFDGLDLDLEYPGCWQGDCEGGKKSEKKDFAKFVEELSAAFKKDHLLLSAAVGATPRIADASYDIPTLGKYLDWISIMAYDYHGTWDHKTGHHAPLYSSDPSDPLSIENTVKYWLQNGALANKLILGIGSYGRSFTLANSQNNGYNAPTVNAGSAGTYTGEAGMLSFTEICINAINGWKVVRDPKKQNGPYAYKGDQWVSFDDVSSVHEKTKHILERKLGGGMFWALDLDDFTDKCGCGKYPLLTAINQGLGIVSNSTVKNCP